MKLVGSEDLTVEEAKGFDCCKDMSDEQIKELLEAVQIFTEIAYVAFANKQHIEGEFTLAA